MRQKSSYTPMTQQMQTTRRKALFVRDVGLRTDSVGDETGMRRPGEACGGLARKLRSEGGPGEDPTQLRGEKEADAGRRPHEG